SGEAGSRSPPVRLGGGYAGSHRGTSPAGARILALLSAASRRPRRKGSVMEAPKQIRPKRLNDYLEVMSKAVFQTGISWKVLEAKWPGFKDAFFDFDPVRIAELDPPDIDKLSEDTRIVRNRKKI